MATSPDPASSEHEMKPEYDFRSLKGIERGKYVERYRERLRLVRLDKDVAVAFADETAVNAALREYLRGKTAN